MTKPLSCLQTKHEPGALVDVLAAFRDNGINLSHIDKRPSGRVNWNYTFYIDADAHRETSRNETSSRNCKCVLHFNRYPRFLS